MLQPAPPARSRRAADRRPPPGAAAAARVTGAVNVHQHLWPEPLLAALARRRRPPLLRRRGSGGWTLRIAGEPDWPIDLADHDVARRARLVEEDGLARALVALSCPLGAEALPGDQARELVDAWHAGADDLPARACPPGRPRASTSPIPRSWRASSTGGRVGLCLPALALAGPEGVARCAPLLALLEERGLPLLVHPGPAPWAPPPPAGPGDPPWWPALTSLRRPDAGGVARRSAPGRGRPTRACGPASRCWPAWRRSTPGALASRGVALRADDPRGLPTTRRRTAHEGGRRRGGGRRAPARSSTAPTARWSPPPRRRPEPSPARRAWPTPRACCPPWRWLYERPARPARPVRSPARPSTLGGCARWSRRSRRRQGAWADRVRHDPGERVNRAALARRARRGLAHLLERGAARHWLPRPRRVQRRAGGGPRRAGRGAPGALPAPSGMRWRPASRWPSTASHVHRVQGVAAGPAVSIHAYSPPLRRLGVYSCRRRRRAAARGRRRLPTSSAPDQEESMSTTDSAPRERPPVRRRVRQGRPAAAAGAQGRRRGVHGRAPRPA